jgi:putative transposase
VEKILSKVETVAKGVLGKNLSKIASAILTMNGRVTMLGISRWSDLSYRTVERFFDREIDWEVISWKLIDEFFDKDETLILLADETVVTKSGDSTHGLGKFYSSTISKAVKGIKFITISVLGLKSGRSFPLLTKQFIQETEEPKVEVKEKSKKVGRPKGSKNKKNEKLEITGLFKVVDEALKLVKQVIGESRKIQYFTYDGAFGNKFGVEVARRNGLELISKLRKDSELYFPSTGEYSGRGKPPTYGDRVDFKKIPEEFLKERKEEDKKKTSIFQLQVIPKKFSKPLNIVVTQKEDLKTKEKTHVIHFSSDLEANYSEILKYYHLRFQIEFSFRDSKQFFGLEDFMNIKKERIHNFSNLALFMNNVSFFTSKEEGFENYSVSNIKSLFNAQKYILETLNYVRDSHEVIFNSELVRDISSFAMIHPQTG